MQRLKPRVDAIGKRLFGLDINKTTYEIKMYNDGARIFVYDSNITCLFKQGARANTIILNSFDDEPTLDSIQCLKR